MKNLGRCIGMLLALQSIYAAESLNSRVSGLFFDETFTKENIKADEQSDGRIGVDCDIDSLEAFESFKTTEVSVVLPDGEKIKSSLYLKDQELKIKVNDDFVVIGSVLKIRAALFAHVTAEAYIEDAKYVLLLKLSPSKEKSI